MKYQRLALLTGLVLMVLACGSSKAPVPAAARPATKPAAAISAPPSGGQAHYQVMMTDYKFTPDSLNVMAGDTVTWVNQGAAPHTTTSGKDGKPDGKWDSNNINPGGTYSHVFTVAGTYPYYCTPHVKMGMKGVIVATAR